MCNVVTVTGQDLVLVLKPPVQPAALPGTSSKPYLEEEVCLVSYNGNRQDQQYQMHYSTSGCYDVLCSRRFCVWEGEEEVIAAALPISIERRHLPSPAANS